MTNPHIRATGLSAVQRLSERQLRGIGCLCVRGVAPRQPHQWFSARKSGSASGSVHAKAEEFQQGYIRFDIRYIRFDIR